MMLPPPNDFLAYWSGFQLLINGGNPYNHAELIEFQRSLGFLDGLGPIYYSPILFVILAPVLWLPLPASQLLWLLLNLGFLLAAVTKSAELLGMTISPMRAAWITVLFPPSILAIYFGQTSSLVLFSAVLSVLLLLKNRDGLAGIMTLPTLLKPHLVFLLLIPKELKHGRINYQFILGVMGSYLFAILLIEIVSPRILEAYLHSGEDPLEWMGHSPITALRLFLRSPQSPLPILAPALLGVLMVLAQSLRGKIDISRDAPLLLCLSALLTPYIWFFDFLILIPAVLLIYRSGPRARGILFLLTCSWWLLATAIGIDWRFFAYIVAITALVLGTYCSASASAARSRALLL